MTPELIKEIFEKEGINTSACLLYPRTIIPGALCIRHGDDKVYHVYTTARPGESYDKTFPTESEACTYFLIQALSDPTYRKDFKQADLLNWDERRRQILRKYKLQ